MKIRSIFIIKYVGIMVIIFFVFMVIIYCVNEYLCSDFFYCSL